MLKDKPVSDRTETREATGLPVTDVDWPSVRVCVEADGEIGIDIDFGPRDSFTFSLSTREMGFSALTGDVSAHGRKQFDTPLPEHVIARLKTLLTAFKGRYDA